jgi:hypothetical protein
MTRINWDEVNQLTRLDEIIAYSIITLQEAYTAPNNDDLDVDTKNDVSDWVRWEIAYDERGRAFFRYAASLYVVDRHPMGDMDFLDLINSPTKWLVNHSSVSIDARTEDTTLTIDPLSDIPSIVTTMEKLLFWAIVLGDWWVKTLNYLANTEIPDIPTDTPIGNWGALNVAPGTIIEGEETGTIDAQFDEYNGELNTGDLPDFLKSILDGSAKDGTGDFKQNIDLPTKDAGAYRENLTTCEEQDPAIKTFSLQSLEILLPARTPAK